MSETPSNNALDVAAASASGIIEFFGGVRPLAKKLDLAASTVQGWKLRDHIPENYHHRLKNLLQEVQDDLAALEGLDKSDSDFVATTKPAETTTTVSGIDKSPANRPVPPNPNAAYFAMPQSTVKYWVMSSLASLGLLAMITLILLFVFFGHDFMDYLTAEHEVATMAPPVTPPPVPAPTPIQNDLQQSRDAIDETLDSVKKIKQDANPQQKELVEQIDRIENVVTSLRGRVDDLDKTLQTKGVDAGAIRQEINNLSRRDVLAAALLLGVAQIHGMLDKQAEFSQDLAFLKALSAHDPEMIKSLDKLAPFAEKGFMTRDQMVETLNMVSHETIKISVEQPNLSWSQKLWQAMSNVIEIRRRLPVTKTVDGNTSYDVSTPQGQVAQAKDYIQNDQFGLAAQILQNYDGPQAAQILDVAQNAQGREAAMGILDELLQKSQGLLDMEQLKNLMTPAATSTTTSPAGIN